MLNSSFSPPASRIWNLQFQSNGSRDEAIYGPSSSTHSKEGRIRINDDQYTNHHYSVSDGALSYFQSPANIFQAPQLGESSTSAGGVARREAFLFPPPTESCFDRGASSAFNSIRSASSLSESDRWGSIGKQPTSFPLRNFPARRSFMSKPVYPLMFRNPVSDSESCELAETGAGNRLTPIEHDKMLLRLWPGITSSPDHKFQSTFTELQKMESSPGPSTSSRREGFRWSNASSYDLGFEDGLTLHTNLENQRSLASTANQKCGLCKRLLCQKSPWSSHRIIRSGDMPVAGVLPCSHVFHADCLEETTPRAQIHDPPCPLCTRAIRIDESVSFSEPLQVALRSACRGAGTAIVSMDAISSYDLSLEQNGQDLKKNRTPPLSVLHQGGSSFIKKHFRKHFPFKGKIRKDFFGSNAIGRIVSSSSASPVSCPGKHATCSRPGVSFN